MKTVANPVVARAEVLSPLTRNPDSCSKDFARESPPRGRFSRGFARFARASGRVEWDVIYDAARCGYGDWENAEKQEHLQRLRS